MYQRGVAKILDLELHDSQLSRDYYHQVSRPIDKRCSNYGTTLRVNDEIYAEVHPGKADNARKFEPLVG